jgi:hypothetical protein
MWMPLLFATLLCLAPRVQAQPTRPMGYWRFENPTPTQEASNNGYNVIINTTNLALGNTNPIVGQYYNVTGVNPTPAVSATIDDASTMTEVVLEFWFRATPGTETGSASWSNKANFYFFEDRLIFDAFITGGLHSMTIDLGGTGVADANYVYDGNWHHIVAQFSACTGEQRVYIDGQSPAGFFIHRQPGGQVRNGGNLHFSGTFPVDRLIGHLDEFAVYDTLLPHWLVYQHYLDGLAGQPYSFPTSFAGVLPVPLPGNQPGYNPLEFVPGYPGATPNPADAFDQYPLPRYRPNVAMRRNLPWESNFFPYKQTGLTDSANSIAARHIYEELAHDWNYYLYAGATHGMISYLTWSPNVPVFGANIFRKDIMEMLNDPKNAGLPRFIISNWGQVRPDDYQATLPPGSFIWNQNLPDSFYCRLANGTPNLALFPNGFKRKTYAMGKNSNNYRINTIGLDGLTQRLYLDSLMRRLDIGYLDLIGENDETQGTDDSTEVLKDLEIAADYAIYRQNNLGPNNLVYQADRLQTIRKKYRDPFVAYIDSINALVGKPPVELWWYDLAGNAHIYHKQRDIARYIDGKIRPGPYVYPQVPGAWRTGSSIFRGVNKTVESIYYQQLNGDSLFIPAISPGFNDNQYIVQDVNMIRPGQFLGLLKGFGGLGSEAYNLFLYHATAVPTNGSWRVWQAPMLSYAQAIFSRAKNFHYNGRVLNGDIAFTYSGSVPTYYTFSSGNSQDFIIVRKLHGQAKYLITASAQRLSNAPGAGDLVRTISFRLHDNNVNILNPITLDARLQGSTYILDLSQPGDTTFHQLDRWHEWKEPSHWCRDFEFDAEVWDSANAALTIRTERPAGAAVGDYSDFTSYIQFPTTTAQAQYQFQTRGPDQDSLYLWVRARNLGSTSANVLARLGTGAQQSLPIAPGGWAWYGRTVSNQPIRFSTLADSVAYLLGIQVGSTQIEIDRVALKRSPADFSSQPFIVTATATASGSSAGAGCIGDSIQFAAGGLQPDGCVDYAWDFGDGGESYVANPAHMYQHPGTYSAVLSVTHGCLGLTLSDTVTVTINAPLVDAGPDRFACLGTSIQLTDDTTNASSFKWRPNPALSGGNALHPTITVTTSGYFYLEGTDTLSGCSLTDSVWVTRVSMPALAYPDTVVACPGQVKQLNVTGAFRVDWFPRPTLTVINNTGRADVLPAVSGYYPFMATDACACDTVIDSIFVRIDSSFLINPVVQPIVEFCPGTSTSVQLQGVAGAAHYAWSPVTGLSFPGSTAPGTVQNPFATVSGNTTYTLTATNALGCVAIGTVSVVQDLTIPNAQIVQPDTTICLGNSITLTGSGVGTFLWTPGNATTASITVSPSATASFILTFNDGGACPGGDTVIVTIDSTSLTSPLLADTVEFCPGLPAQLQGVPGMASYAWSPATGLSATTVQSPFATVSTATTYTITATNLNGCIANGTVALVQDLSIPSAQIVQPDTTICLGNSITLTGSGVGTFLWTPGNATTSSISVSPSATSSYTFSVNDGGACPGRDSVVVTVDTTSLNPPILADTVEFCPGLPAQLQGVPGMASYTWSPATGLSATSVQSPFATVGAATTYTLTAINLNGCTAVDTVALVQDLSIPTAQIVQPDTTICLGNSITLTGSGVGTFLWTPGNATTASITVSPAVTTSYVFSVDDGGACPGRDTVVVMIDSTSLTSPLLADTVEFCPGLPALLQGVPGMASYAWSPATGLSASTVQSPTATVSSATTYTLTATNLNGCTAVDTVALVQDLSIPSAQVLTPDTLICGTWSVQLQGTGAGSYLWTPSGATSSTPTVTPTASTTYTLTVNDGGACVGRDSVRVDLYACCLQTALPYAFLNARASDIAAVFGGNVVNQSISLNGTTLIDVPLTVTGPGTHVYMGDSALIEVQPGDSLVLEDQASIEAGCGEMWMAIELDGPTARLVTRDSATIRDGIEAVRSVGGGVFDIRDSRLLNNRRGIVVLPFAQPHLGRVTGTRFAHSGGLLAPYAGAKAEAGIDIDAVRSIPIGASGASYNRFSGMRVGVDVFNSNTTLQHNHFVLLGDTAAIGIRAAATPGHPGAGIIVGHPNLVPGPALDACKNIFEGGKHGVHLDDPGNAYLRGNTFVSSTNTAAFARRTDGRAVVIDHNTFDKNALAVFWGYSLNTSGSVSKNQITGDINTVRRGIRFDLLNSNLPAPPDIQVKENVIDLRGAGIWIATSDHINVENNDILVRRATNAPLSEMNYGVYLNSNSKVRVVNNQKIRSIGSGSTSINVHGIYVRTSNESVVNCNTLSWLGRHVVFEGYSRPTDFLGNSMMHGVDGFVLKTSGEIGEQGNAFTNRPCDNAWHGTFTNSWTHAIGSVGDDSQFNVRNHLPYLPPANMSKASGLNSSPMTPDTTLFTNYLPVQCYNTLPVYSVKGGVKSVAKQRVPDGDFQQEDQFRIDEWAYATLLADPTLLVDEPELQAYFDDMKATPLATAVKAQGELREADSSKAADYAALLNADIPTEANHRSVLEIRLDGPVIDNAELVTLTAIAAQCERAGGKGVNMARGLLAAEGVMVWDDPECPVYGKAAQPAGGDANDVQARCWPNPTDGLLHIDFSEAGQQGRLKVFDALGRLLEERDFDYQDTPIVLDGGRWSQGLLLVVAEMADGSRHPWRILLRQ